MLDAVGLTWSNVAHVNSYHVPEPDGTILAAAGLKVEGIGDCKGLGLIAGATRDAAEAVARLSGEP